MPEKTAPSIVYVLDNFFNSTDVKEFLQNYLPSEEKISLPDDHLQEDGSSIRRQTDLLITFAESKLSEDKLILLLLHLANSMTISGEFTTAIEINLKIIKTAKEGEKMTDILANAYLSIGEIQSRMANWEESFTNIIKAREAFDSILNLNGAARCENLLGTIYGDVGDLTKATINFEAALNLLAEENNDFLSGKIDINLGIVNTIQGNYDEAFTHYKRALLKSEKLSDLERIAEIRHNMGMVFTKMKNYDSALDQFDESIKASFQSGYLQTLGLTYLSKAYIYSQINDYNLGMGFAEKAMEVAHKLNDKLSIAEVYKIKGILQKNLGNSSTAENYFLTSLRINKETGNQLNYAETCNELGILYKEMNRMEESKKKFAEALEYYKTIHAEGEIDHLEKQLSFKS